jgi:hypothetical protein
MRLEVSDQFWWSLACRPDIAPPREQLLRTLWTNVVYGSSCPAYALMSNHYHLVVRIDCQRALAWLPREVVERLTRLFAGVGCAHRYRRAARCVASVLAFGRFKAADKSKFLHRERAHRERRWINM